MPNIFLELNLSIKELLREKINIVIFIIVISILFNVFSLLYINSKINKICKKIDHRYFNLNNTIEQINDVRINTYNGDLKQKI